MKNFYHSLDNDVVKLWNEDTEAKDLEILQQLRILVDSPDAGDNKLIGIRIEQGKYGEDLWFYNRGRLYPMNVDYEGLLNALLETRGIGNWEYFFCDFDPTFTLDTYIPGALRKDLEALKILFPETDYSFYEERLKELITCIQSVSVYLTLFLCKLLIKMFSFGEI